MTLEPILVQLMKTFLEKFQCIKDIQKSKKPQIGNLVLLEAKIFKFKKNFMSSKILVRLPSWASTSSSTNQCSFSWKGGRSWHSGSMKLCSLKIIPPLSIVQIKVNLSTEAGYSPKPNSICTVNIAIPDIPVLTRGPALVQPDKSGQAFLQRLTVLQIL